MGRGRKSTGSIRVRGDYQFRASVEIDGREKSKTFTTRLEAEEWIEGLLQAKTDGRSTNWLEARAVTLAEGLQRYLAEFTPHKKSADTETRNIEAFLAPEAELCAKSLHDIRTTDLKTLIKRRMKPTDPSIRAIAARDPAGPKLISSELLRPCSEEGQLYARKTAWPRTYHQNLLVRLLMSGVGPRV